MSKSRQVWLALVKQYSSCVQPKSLWLEKPLDLHTSAELEQLLLRWKSVKAGWAVNRPNEPVLHQRHFFVEDMQRHSAYLVKGGRWLLVGTRSGTVLYYDLNAPIITPSLLVGLQPCNYEHVRELKISVDVDLDAEPLTFYLAVLSRRSVLKQLPLRNSHRWIQVWRVTSDIGTDGHVKGLITELVSSFREESESLCFSFNIRGRYVAYQLFYSPSQVSLYNDGHRVVVVDWTTMCTTTSLDYTRKIIPCASASVSFILILIHS